MSRHDDRCNPALAMIGKLTVASTVVMASLAAANIAQAAQAGGQGGSGDSGASGDPSGGPDTFTGQLDDTYQYTHKRCVVSATNRCSGFRWQVKGNW